MRKAWIACAAAGCLGAVSADGVAAVGLLPERVQKAADERVLANRHQALVIAVVDGERSEVVAFGLLDNGTPPDVNTVFEIGSITKVFTATLLAQAVLSGRLALDTPVATLLPDFSLPKRSGQAITLGDLATQHSGLPRLPANLRPQDPANPYAGYGPAELQAGLAGTTLPAQAAGYGYSNLGFGLLGHALAHSQRTSFEDLTAQVILKPLGMAMTGMALTPDMQAHLAPGHDESGKPAPNWDFDALAGAGALRSTARDVLRFLQANMGQNAGTIGPALAFAQTPLRPMDPHTRIGLAWMTTDQGVTWHNGGTGGYRSFIGWTADRRHGVVVLTNSATAVDDLGMAALLPGAPLAPVRQQVAMTAVALNDFVGTYRLAEGFLLRLFQAEGQLYAQATGQGAFPVYPSAPNEFFAKAAPIALSFVRNPQGAVTQLVLHQGGDHVAPRLSEQDIPPEPGSVSLDPKLLADCVGSYRFSFGAVLRVTLSGRQLEARLGDQPSLPIHARAPDQFFYTVVDAQLDFERDASGQVVAVVLHQGGQDQRALRVAR